MEGFKSDLRDEEGLVLAASRGDASAFEDLFHRYYDMIYGYAYKMCFNTAEASDLTQETWIKVARSLYLYQGKASFKSWVYAVAHNVIQDAGRKKARDLRLKEQMAGEISSSSNEDTHPDGESLRAALHSLSPNHHAAVTLVYMEGLSHGEAARVLGCAETTISWRLFQARRKLRRILVLAAKEQR